MTAAILDRTTFDDPEPCERCHGERRLFLDDEEFGESWWVCHMCRGTGIHTPPRVQEDGDDVF